MSGYTPGPWRLAETFVKGKYGSHDRWVCEITCPKGNLIIADIPEYRTYPEETPMIEANARLIAAAPALHQAAEAMAAWFWAENSHETSWKSRLELCNYAEYLTNKALAIADGRELPQSYEGMPRIVVSFPRAGLERHEADEVQATVNELLVKYRAAIAKATGAES